MRNYNPFLQNGRDALHLQDLLEVLGELQVQGRRGDISLCVNDQYELQRKGRRDVIKDKFNNTSIELHSDIDGFTDSLYQEIKRRCGGIDYDEWQVQQRYERFYMEED